jgi:acyl-CoA thioesterase-1
MGGWQETPSKVLVGLGIGSLLLWGEAVTFIEVLVHPWIHGLLYLGLTGLVIGLFMWPEPPRGQSPGAAPPSATSPVLTPLRRLGSHHWLVLSVALVVGLGNLGGYLWAGHRSPRRPLDPTRQTVVFFGDSITAGDRVPPEATFAARLGARLGVPIRNAGLSGDTTAGGLRRLQRDVLAYHPKLVIVELGINDALGERRPSGETLGNLRQLARLLRADGTRVVLIHTAVDDFGSALYRAGFRDIARYEGAWLVEDLFDGVIPNQTVDGLHPSVEGHAVLASRLAPLVRRALRP